MWRRTVTDEMPRRSAMAPVELPRRTSSTTWVSRAVKPSPPVAARWSSRTSTRTIARGTAASPSFTAAIARRKEAAEVLPGKYPTAPAFTHASRPSASGEGASAITAARGATARIPRIATIPSPGSSNPIKAMSGCSRWASLIASSTSPASAQTWTAPSRAIRTPSRIAARSATKTLGCNASGNVMRPRLRRQSLRWTVPPRRRQHRPPRPACASPGVRSLGAHRRSPRFQARCRHR